MLKLSKKTEYALMALLHMDTMGEGERASVAELSKRYAIPEPLLGKVLQALARAGLVEAVHGAFGGYRRARALTDLKLGDVVTAVDGPPHLAACHEDPAKCGQYAECTIRRPVMKVQNEMLKYMHGVSLAEFKGGMKESPLGAAVRS